MTDKIIRDGLQKENVEKDKKLQEGQKALPVLCYNYAKKIAYLPSSLDKYAFMQLMGVEPTRVLPH